MKRRNIYKKVLIASYIFLTATGLGIFGYIKIFGLGEHPDRPFLFLILPLVTMTTVLFMGFKYYRCQHCGKFLMKVPFNAEKCPFCGENLNEEARKN